MFVSKTRNHRAGQLRPFTVRLTPAVFRDERCYRLNVNVPAPGSQRNGQIIPASFAVLLPESLAVELHEALGRALEDHGAIGPDGVTILPGLDDVR